MMVRNDELPNFEKETGKRFKKLLNFASTILWRRICSYNTNSVILNSES
jgi:hypothetical protein